MSTDVLNSRSNANRIISVYKDEYSPWPYSKQAAIIPLSEWEQPRSAQVEKSSGYQLDYPPRAVEMRRTQPRPPWAGFGEPFLAQSTHNAEFQYRAADPAKKIEPKSELQLDRSSPMQGRTTNSDAYLKWSLPERHRHQYEHYDPPTQIMDCKTSYHEDYLKHGYVKLPPIRPNERKDSPKPFESSTENKDAYKEFDRHNIAIIESFRPRWEYVPPSEKFHNATSYSGEFTPRKLERTHSFKPNREYKPPENSFAVETSYQEEFSPRRGEKSISFKPLREYQPPSESMEKFSTYKGQYEYSQEHRTLTEQRTPSYKPHRQYMEPTEPVATITSYSGQFSDHDGLQKAMRSPTESFKPLRVYEAPTVPVVGLSSYQGDFLGGRVDRPHAFRPKENLERSLDVMESKTTMRTSYVPKVSVPVTVVKPQPTINLKHDYF